MQRCALVVWRGRLVVGVLVHLCIINDFQLIRSGYVMTNSNGPLIIGIRGLVEALQWLSVVEWMKWLAVRQLVNRNPSASSDERRSFANNAIDVFIIIKWLVVLVALVTRAEGETWSYVLTYLVFFNLFSYFYYHAWGGGYPVSPGDKDRQQRRLLSFLQAFFFSIFAFAYIYLVPLCEDVLWPEQANGLDALLLSVSNSFTLTYEGFQPATRLGRAVLVIQVLNSFFFLTVLVANSLPNLSGGEGT
jgi:hypothetical protein